MKTVIVDVDDTLMSSGRVSYFLWSLSSLLQRIGRRLQKGDREVATELRKYDRVIVLTSRDLKDAQFTQRQLHNNGIRFDRLICCPRKQVLTQWKVAIIGGLAAEGELDWIDDAFDEGYVPELQDSTARRVRTLRPSAISHLRRSPKHDPGLERL